MSITLSWNQVIIWLLQAGNSLSVLCLCLPWECSKYYIYYFTLCHNGILIPCNYVNLKIKEVFFHWSMFARTYTVWGCSIWNLWLRDFQGFCFRSSKILQKDDLRSWKKSASNPWGSLRFLVKFSSRINNIVVAEIFTKILE